MGEAEVGVEYKMEENAMEHKMEVGMEHKMEDGLEVKTEVEDQDFDNDVDYFNAINVEEDKQKENKVKSNAPISYVMES